MSVLAEEESHNQALVNALTAHTENKSTTSSVTIETPKSPNSKQFPATSLKLSSILKKTDKILD